jgi:hypothetical protein
MHQAEARAAAQALADRYEQQAATFAASDADSSGADCSGAEAAADAADVTASAAADAVVDAAVDVEGGGAPTSAHTSAATATHSSTTAAATAAAAAADATPPAPAATLIPAPAPEPDRPWLAVYRSILPRMGEGDVAAEIASLPTRKRWAFIFLRGGHFAAAVFNGDKVSVHKCFHRYVVRAKQGGLQSAHDNKGKAAVSAGSNIRRYNEVELNNDITRLLTTWKAELANAHLIFLQAPVRQKTVFFLTGLLDKADSRIRSVPISTGRPVLRELQRIHAILAAVYHPDTPSKWMLQQEKLACDGGGGAGDGKSSGKARTTAAASAAAAAEAAAAAAAEEAADPHFNDSPLYTACMLGAGGLEKVQTLLRLPELLEGYEIVRCAFFDRNLHARMLLSFTPLLLRLKRYHAWDRCNFAQVSSPLTG